MGKRGLKVTRNTTQAGAGDTMPMRNVGRGSGNIKKKKTSVGKRMITTKNTTLEDCHSRFVEIAMHED